MLTNPVSKIFIMLAVLAAALVSISFANRSTPAVIVHPGAAHLSDFYERHPDWTSQTTSDFSQRFEARTMAGISVDTSDYYMRHPEWTWANSNAAAMVPVTGRSEYSDYYQRHPELSAPAAPQADTSDYFLRHPELRPLGKIITDLTDYFFRHPELSVSTNVPLDTSDYFLRHPELNQQ